MMRMASACSNRRAGWMVSLSCIHAQPVALELSWPCCISSWYCLMVLVSSSTPAMPSWRKRGQ